MANYEVTENPEYTEKIRKFETIDPGHASIFNRVIQALVGNIAFVKKIVDAHIGENGGKLSEKYAKKSVYGDGSLNMGRAEGAEIGEKSFAFGDGVTASGFCAHAEGGNGVHATGDYSHAEGEENAVASGRGAHAEGAYVHATGDYSHAEGFGNTEAGGNGAHAEGMGTDAGGACSHTEGAGTKAPNYGAHAGGKFNKDMATGGGVNTQVGDVFVVGNGTEYARSNALRVTYQGDVLGTKAFQSSGADYAEFIKPWADGNPDNEDRVGYFVTGKDGLLHKANEGDYILGITSGNPSVVGNADEDYYWRYERDNFNRIVMEDEPETVQATDDEGNHLFNEETHEPVMVETGNIISNARMKLAKDYDPSLQENYIPRSERPEWDYVGMLGVLPVRDDGTCQPDGFCRCGAGGVATFTQERGVDTYYVIERISDDVVNVLLK